MNKVILIGNLTRDPEISVTQSGISVCRFSIAVSRNYTNADGERETDFFNVVAWRGLADNCAKYLGKGKKVCLVGSLQNSEYEDREGNRRTKTEVIASDVEFLSPADKEPSEAKPAPKAKKKTVEELTPIDSDDLPF